MTRQDASRVDYCLVACGSLSLMIGRGAPASDLLRKLAEIKGTLNVMKAGAAKAPRRPKPRAVA